MTVRLCILRFCFAMLSLGLSVSWVQPSLYALTDNDLAQDSIDRIVLLPVSLHRAQETDQPRWVLWGTEDLFLSKGEVISGFTLSDFPLTIHEAPQTVQSLRQLLLDKMLGSALTISGLRWQAQDDNAHQRLVKAIDDAIDSAFVCETLPLESAFGTLEEMLSEGKKAAMDSAELVLLDDIDASPKSQDASGGGGSSNPTNRSEDKAGPPEENVSPCANCLSGLAFACFKGCVTGCLMTVIEAATEKTPDKSKDLSADNSKDANPGISPDYTALKRVKKMYNMEKGAEELWPFSSVPEVEVKDAAGQDPALKSVQEDALPNTCRILYMVLDQTGLIFQVSEGAPRPTAIPLEVLMKAFDNLPAEPPHTWLSQGHLKLCAGSIRLNAEGDAQSQAQADDKEKTRCCGLWRRKYKKSRVAPAPEKPAEKTDAFDVQEVLAGLDSKGWLWFERGLLAPLNHTDNTQRLQDLLQVSSPDEVS